MSERDNFAGQKPDFKKKEAWTVENARQIAGMMGYECDDNFMRVLSQFIDSIVTNSIVHSLLPACFEGTLTQAPNLKKLPHSKEYLDRQERYLEAQRQVGQQNRIGLVFLLRGTLHPKVNKLEKNVK